MTKSAKQDPKAPAKPAAAGAAATEPAATEPAATEDAAAGDATAGDAAAVSEATAAEPSAEAATAKAGEPAKPDLDETKRKFREALERKHEGHADGQGKGGRDAGKINGAHGPAANRRNFRRKSG